MPATGFLHRPRVSRETRRLLSAAALALLTLWLLARVRYPEASVAPNPVPPLLAQLAPPARFAELATEIRTLSDSLKDDLVVVTLTARGERTTRVALRVRPGVAALVMPGSSQASVPAPALVADRPSGLLLVPADQGGPVALPRPWRPLDQSDAEYLFAVFASPDASLGVHPVLVSQWTPVSSAAWQGEVWRLPPDVTVSPGAFLFTTGGELAGVSTRDQGRPVIVPASLFYSLMEAVGGAPADIKPGWVGITVTDLNERLAAATGVTRGVLVTDVDAGTVRRGLVRPGDVVTSVNGVAVGSAAEWSAIVDRLRVDDVIRLQTAASAGDVVEVTAQPLPSRPSQLGARLRRVNGRTEVASTDPRSAATLAGLQPGDVLVRVGDVDDPTPAQVTAAFTAESDVPLLVVYMRAGTSHATALER